MGNYKNRVSALFEKTQVEKKNTNFRSWKKGKSWLFASALVASVIGGGATMIGGASDASADTVTPSTSETTQADTDSTSAVTSEVAVGSTVATSSAAMSISTSESAMTSEISSASSESTSIASGAKSVANESSTATSVAATSVQAQPVTSSSVEAPTAPVGTEARFNTAAATSQMTTTPALITKDVTVNKGQAFRQAAGFVEATDSTGKTVDKSAISITGVVNSNIAGTYFVLYSFVDVNGATVTGKTQVNVRDTTSPVVTTSDVANQTTTSSLAVNGGAGMTLSSNAANALQSSAVQSLSSQVATAISNGDMSLASSAMNSFANTDAGKSFASNAVDMINSAASSMNSLGSLMADSQVQDFKNQLSAAVTSSDTALAKSLIASFAATSQGSILMSMASNMPTTISNATISSIMSVASSMATTSGSASTNDATSVANAFIATSEGQTLISNANSAAILASNASSAAVSEFAQTSEGRAMMSALDSYASNAQYKEFNEAMSEAVAESNASLASSLANSFFATSLGAQFGDDMKSYEATDAYKSMMASISSSEDALGNSIKESMTLAGLSLNPSDLLSGASKLFSGLNPLSGANKLLSNFNPMDVLKNITGTIWNVVSGVVQTINPIRILPDWSGSSFGEFAESWLGGVLGATFYGTAGSALAGFGANAIAVIPVGLTSTLMGLIPILGWAGGLHPWVAMGWIGGISAWFGGTISSGMGAYYGSTMGKGLSKDGHVDNIVSGTAIGATLGAIAGTTINDWLVGYVGAHVLMMIPTVITTIVGTIGTITGVIAPFTTAIASIVTPLLVTAGTFIGAPIGAAIGGAIGGAIGALTKAMGISLTLPDASQLVKDIAALPGISDLLSTIKEVTAKAGTVVTKAVTVAKGGVFNLKSGFDKATDSNGKDVAASLITATGSVNTKVPGVYIVDYSYPDSGTNTITHGYAQVTVTA
ncbi:hypothetical protein ESZ50_09065 [Weissella muntiaci]|uniref:Ig-like domain-containing protein n=1 Tax=Weissella muntiaci TaxID=2508881 RepID=A0A6C2C316_9LACO|nr:bacterial Ig-like domain-containing protein [Weissella muntiaci]TYC48351.1 hypothetical protein ESZ50_09065 [Weissella muntiaci]